MFVKMNNNNEESQQQLTSLISKEINTTQIQVSPQINKISSTEDNSQNNLSDLSSILKEIPLHNLNDYYNIETNVFKKRIEKLNLQFFWIYESIFEGQNSNNNDNINNTNADHNSKQTLIFPYNKLFLILFKEISLYIEEIIRLNKQLNAKNKNEKFYLKKLNDFKNKEKEYYMNKHIIKTLQRNIRNMEKTNEKLKNEIEKLNKKIFNAKYTDKFTVNNNVNNYRYKNYQKANTIYNEYYGFNNITEQGSLMSSDSNKFSVRTYINKFKDKNFNNMNDINNINKSPSKDFLNVINKDMNKLINSCSRLYEKNGNNVDKNNYLILSINQCQDEINNLNMIESLLTNYTQHEKEDIVYNTKRNPSYNKLINTPISHKFKNRRNDSSTNNKKIFTDKRYKKMNKSLDFKSNIIINRNKS